MVNTHTHTHTQTNANAKQTQTLIERASKGLWKEQRPTEGDTTNQVYLYLQLIVQAEVVASALEQFVIVAVCVLSIYVH